MKILQICVLLVAGGIAATVGAAVPPVPIDDDNGNWSFVRQVVPKLLGRKPKGTEEVKLLVDLSELHGREAVVRMLMEQPEFSTHWTATIIDHMDMQRETGRVQSAQCFGGPMPAEPVGLNEQIVGDSQTPAEFVRDNDLVSSYPQTFNMYELIQSSIELDNLFPAYRGYQFPIGAKRPALGGMASAAEIRARVGTAFDEAFLNRNMECMSCHRGTYSTTGIGDRTHPLYKTLDVAVFDHTGLGENVPAIANALYVTNCFGCHGSAGEGNGSVPGILDAKAMDISNAINSVEQMNFLANLLDDTDIQSIADSLEYPGVFGDGMFAETAAKHYGVFRSDLFAIDDPAVGWGPWGMSTECVSIDASASLGAIPAFFAGVDADYASLLDVDGKLQSGYQNLPGLLESLYQENENNVIPGDVAFAYMLAAKITENVWEQLMGEPLTIVNYFARNARQKNQHQYLTEDVFLANQWSLKELIVEILQARFFNRHAPVSSASNDPYVLHAIFDPFIPADRLCTTDPDDRDPDDSREEFTKTYTTQGTGEINQIGTYTNGALCAHNGQGELVHRYSPRSLLQSISAALNWPAPRLFPNSSYPSMSFSKAIGQYISDFDKGTKDVSFQGLLNWDGAYGTCAKAPTGVDDDWIDTLRNEIDVFNAAHPEQSLTLGEVVLTLKDWLLQEPVFGGYRRESDSLIATNIFTTKVTEVEVTFTESQLVEALFDTSLDSAVTTAGIADEDLRQLCGVYLKAPQFMLAGIVRNDTFQAPRFRVCNEEPCSYQSMCEGYQPALSQLGHGTSCTSDSVSEAPMEFYTVKTPCLDCEKQLQPSSAAIYIGR